MPKECEADYEEVVIEQDKMMHKKLKEVSELKSLLDGIDEGWNNEQVYTIIY